MTLWVLRTKDTLSPTVGVNKGTQKEKGKRVPLRNLVFDGSMDKSQKDPFNEPLRSAILPLPV